MPDEPQDQMQDDSENAAMLSKCPLEPSRFIKLLHSQLLTTTLQMIEEHISASNQCHHPPLKEFVFHGPLDGTTPLIYACQYGALDIVKYLVDHWDVNVQATAVYYEDPLRSSAQYGMKVTPLYAAAHGRRHLETVKYLIAEKNADVSSRTSSGRTPLHGALNHRCDSSLTSCTSVAAFLLNSGADPNALGKDGAPIWSPFYRRCELGLIEELIRHGLNLDLRNSFGDTILHQLADKGNLYAPEHGESEIAAIQLLIQNGADPMARNNSGFTPALKAANCRNWTLVDFFLESNVIGRVEKIEAMEMAAARIIWEPSINDLDRAFRYLRNALALRTEPGPLHMTAMKLKRGRIIGWTTTAELDQVIENPSQYELHSYLVRLRICSGRSWKAILDLYEDSHLYQRFHHLEPQERLANLLDVLWGTLETIQHHLQYHCEGIWKLVDKVTEGLIRVVSQLDSDDPLFCAETFKTMLEVVLAADRSYSRSADLESPSHLHALFQLSSCLANHLPEEILNEGNDMVPIDSSAEQKLHIKGLLYQLLSQDSRSTTGQSLLHMACDDQHFDLATIRLMLEVHADPNAVDEKGNAPLHVLASKRSGNDQVITSAARLLLENGAHLDRVNEEGKTAAELWEEKNVLQHLPNWLLEPGMVRS